MQHQFSITTVLGKNQEGLQLRSPVTVFQAETELESTPQLVFPKTITGKLVPSITPEKFLQLQSQPGVQVGFEGKGYTFSKLKQDGSFELRLIEP